MSAPGRYAIICAIPTAADPTAYLAAAAESEGMLAKSRSMAEADTECPGVGPPRGGPTSLSTHKLAVDHQ